MHVLVLDDDLAFRRSLERELGRLGHEPAAFGGWSSALDFLDEGKPADVIVTALEFKKDGPNGVSFALMARRRRPSLKLLFIGPSADVADQVDPGLGVVALKEDGAEKIASLVQTIAALEV